MGSIPAHAGKPLWLLQPPGLRRVYPRACGETSGNPIERPPRKGLSPRMRGNRNADLLDVQGAGSIPAHAGKPRRRRGWRPWSRVYPRACGETPSPEELSRVGRGLSPRMRGNQLGPGGHAHGQGSIPAHAGKPYLVDDVNRHTRVYPRACGETSIEGDVALQREGLSPRMRGNPRSRSS